MRSTSTDLVSFLLSKQPWWSADLFTFSLPNGQTLRYTTGDVNITFGGNTWLCASASSFALTRKNWQVKNTMDVPQMEVELISTGTDYVAQANIKLLMHNGFFDGAWIEMDRAFMPVSLGYGNTSLGTVPIFAGPCGQVEITATGAKITVRGANVKHQQYMPRNRFLTSCIHALYDGGCKVVKATYTFAGTVSTANKIQFNWTSDPTSGHYLNLISGYVTMTSGVAQGTQRTIGNASSTGISFIYPFYEIPQAGDTFNVVYGCNKTLNQGPTANCTTFSNTQNYRGFPFVPPADAAL